MNVAGTKRLVVANPPRVLMRRIPLPPFDNCRHLVPQHQVALGQVVLVHLLDDDGQGQYFSHAVDKADRGILNHRPPDAAETAGRDGRPEPPVPAGRLHRAG